LPDPTSIVVWVDLSELRDLLLRHTDQTLLPGVTIKASTTVTEPMPGVTHPVIALVAQGAKRTVLGDQVLTYAAGQFLIVSTELPVTAHVTEASTTTPYVVFGLTLQPALIAALLLDARPDQRPADRPGIAVSPVTPDLLDPIVRLLRLLDRPDDLPVLAAGVEREIVWRLLTGSQGPMVRQIGLADSRLSQIGRAIRWIRTHYAESFPIAEPARVAAMSPTSFHRHFRAITTMSPIQFQKQIRLQEARALLLADAGDVAGVGFAVGYESASQFNREYRRMFGLPPGQDAARLHQIPEAERVTV
jgi:AraC-like DNA-binding protein